MDAPPASATGRAGNGPSTAVTLPAPVSTNGGATRSTPVAAAVPLFVTVSVTSTAWPVQADPGTRCATATSAAAASTVADTLALATRTVAPVHVTPEPDAVNVTTPAPVAVTPKTNVCEVPATIVTGPAGTGFHGRLTKADPGFT